MKKKILVGTLLFNFFYNYSFADLKDSVINQRVKESFYREFVNAEEVQWEDHESCVKVNFKLVGQVLSAYFDPEGELLAVTRNISSDHLTDGSKLGNKSLRTFPV
jgi:hypothetical protein